MGIGRGLRLGRRLGICQALGRGRAGVRAGALVGRGFIGMSGEEDISVGGTSIASLVAVVL